MAVQLGRESWQSIWPEVRGLTEAHSEEVDSGVESRREFKLDLEQLQAASDWGILRIYTARRPEGQLVGYLTWQISMDLESEGLKIAQQGAWYMAPGWPLAAAKLFLFSLEDLRSIGVSCVFPHHRLQGRGTGLGRWFRWLGAKPLMHVYCLWIKGAPHA